MGGGEDAFEAFRPNVMVRSHTRQWLLGSQGGPQGRTARGLALEGCFWLA